MFAPYACLGFGQVSTAAFEILQHDERPRITLSEVPLDLLAPYVPVLNDMFVSGSVTIIIDDLTDETQKRVLVSIQLQPDCKIKPAREILVPAIHTALRQWDDSSQLELHDLKRKIERLKTSAESVRTELDRVTQIVDRLSFLAPREVREEYERIKSQYDRAMGAYDERNIQFETLVQDLDLAKGRVVERTFQAFIDSGIPIEVELQEVDGEWQYDAYAVVIGLVERNYRTILATEFQPRFQEIRDAVDRLLVP